MEGTGRKNCVIKTKQHATHLNYSLYSAMRAVDDKCIYS